MAHNAADHCAAETIVLIFELLDISRGENLKKEPYESTLYFRHRSRNVSADFAMAQVPLQPCLEIEDQTKERLDCYDAKIKPAPKRLLLQPRQ